MRVNIFAVMLFLVLGLLTTFLVTFGFALWVDVDTGKASQAEKFVNEEQWIVTRQDRAGAVRVRSTRVRGTNWSPQQAAGTPDTPNLGDQVTAWASKGQDSGMEWLVLDYGKSVTPRELHVYENYCPGALVKVTCFTNDGVEHLAWEGASPSPKNTANAGGKVAISKIPITLNIKTDRVKIYLDSANVSGWNEIDAVALIDDAGQTQWARRVEASSTYASISGGAIGGNPEMLTPAWSGLAKPTPAFADATANREERMVDARGWPFLTLYSDGDALAQSAAAAQLTTLGMGQGAAPLTGMAPAGNLALTGSNTAPMPRKPIMFGIIANTLIYATVLWLIWIAMVHPRRFFRECGRIRSGCCKDCGYDLGYDFIHGCPECGWRKERAEVEGRMAMVEERANGNGNGNV